MTVNSEIFARVLFSRSFAEMKPSRNGEIPLPFTYVRKSCTSPGIFNISNLSFNIIQEN